MAVVDDLFQLIRALTPSEKRYFKIHAKTHVAGKYKNNYEKLFDAMNYWPEEEEYDEKLFKRKHKGKSFLKNLSSEKNYLYELILETMRSFHNEKTIDRQINDLLLDEDFFRKKRLNNQRQKAIEKGKELAKKYEKLPALLSLIECEISMQKEWRQTQLKDLADKASLEEQGVLGQLQTLASLRYFSNRLFIMVRINTIRSGPELQEESNKVINVPVVKNYAPHVSFHTDRHYYRIHALYNRIHQNMQEYERYSKLIYELYEVRYPKQKEASPNAYKVALYNYLNACFMASNLKPFPELLAKAQQISPLSRDEEGEDWQNLIHLQLIYFNNTAQLEKAMALADEIERGLKRYKDKVNRARKMALYYNLGASFFVSAEWGRALDYYNLVLLDKSQARQDLKCSAELLILASQWELKNYDVVLYLLRNAERRFASEGKGYKSFFKYFHELIKDCKTLTDAQQELTTELAHNSELICWVKSIEQQKKIEEIFRETVNPFSVLQ